MSEKDQATSDNQSEDRLKRGSDELTEGTSKVISGVANILSSLWVRAEDHWILRGIAVAVISTVVGGAVLNILGELHSYFYGAAVPISRDIDIGTFPLPVGLSLWIISILLLFVAVTGYFRVVALRQRIEQLEARAEDS